MAENKHTMSDLYQMQSLPLEAKVNMTKNRIRGWYEHWNGDVYVSFSGGKDSTVLLDIARSMYKDIPCVFIDTGLEYPEIRDFVKQYEGVEWIKPKLNFKQVIEKYGYPFISKEVSECVYGARKYLKSFFSAGDNGIILGVRSMCKMLDIELSALDELKRKHFVSDLPSDEFGYIKISTWSDVLGKKERNTFADAEWRKKVKTRDGNICVKCGSKENLHVHHILSYSKYPEMRYDVDNGITLCKDCHLKEHKGDWHNV